MYFFSFLSYLNAETIYIFIKWNNRFLVAVVGNSKWLFAEKMFK